MSPIYRLILTSLTVLSLNSVAVDVSGTDTGNGGTTPPVTSGTTVIESGMMDGDVWPIRYRTHISGPIAPVNRQLTHRQKDASKAHEEKSPKAGGLDNWQFEIGTSWTEITDDVIGDDATAHEYYLGASTVVGDTSLGLTLAFDHFETDNTGLDMKTVSADFYAVHPVADWLDLGVLGIIANSEIDNGPTGIFTWGGGPMASAHTELTDDLSIGLTTSINFYDVDNNYDSLFTALFDANYALTDNWSLYAYGMFNDSLRDTPDDRTFWTVGGQVDYRHSDRLSVSLGYETTVGFTDYDDDTILFSVLLGF